MDYTNSGYKTLDDRITELNCPLDNGRQRGDASFDAGDLDKVPLELVHYTLIDFRHR
jgi:hypothetical protein